MLSPQLIVADRSPGLEYVPAPSVKVAIWTLLNAAPSVAETGVPIAVRGASVMVSGSVAGVNSLTEAVP